MRPDPARPGAWFATQRDRFIPPNLRADADATRRARVLVAFSMVCIVLGCVFSVLALVNYGLPLVVLASALGALASALTPLVLLRTGSLQVATSTMLAVFAAAIVGPSFAAAGQSVLNLPWLTIIPLLATVLAGPRTGIAWGVVCVVLAEATLAISAAIPGQLVLPADTMRVAAASNIALLMVFITSFAVVYEMQRRRMMVALVFAQAELESVRGRAVATDRLASLGRMAAGVAHEINNPMTYVSSNVALLREDLARGPLEPALRREYVEDVLPATEEGIRRVASIVADLRRFARGDTRESVAIDVNHEVQAAVRMCEATLDQRRVSVRLGALPPMMARAGEITQATMNLVANALDATKDGGEVRVETEVSAQQIVLRVVDTGVGMTPEIAARALEPFFTTKPTGEGTGLGLPVVHGIVVAHGGSLRIESTPGAGTTCEVRLPLPTAPSLDAKIAS